MAFEDGLRAALGAGSGGYKDRLRPRGFTPSSARNADAVGGRGRGRMDGWGWARPHRHEANWNDASVPLEMRAMAVEFPEVHGHPNRLPFEGCLTLVDVPSDKAPSGARGHRVVLTRGAAEAALPSLLGMAVDYKAGWDGHDARQKCGIITSAQLEDKCLMVEGYLFARDFPEIEQRIARDPDTGTPLNRLMGMSYELADAHVSDMRAQIWTLTRATFTGAAILLRDKAAYRGTSFRVKRGPKRPLAHVAGAM